MRKRRRTLIAAAALLLTGSLVLCWIRFNRGRASVALVFVGFTNTPPTITQPGNVTSWTIASLPFARMLVTNNGIVPVRVWNGIRPANWGAPGFVRPGASRGQVLRPGESFTVDVGPGTFQAAWWTEVSYQPHCLPERVYRWVWDSGNPTTQKVVGRLVRGPDTLWVGSGWITNQAFPTPLIKSMTRRSLGPIITQGGLELIGFPSSEALPPAAPQGYSRSDVIPWPSIPSSGRRYHITAPLELEPIHLPPLRSPPDPER